VSPLSREAYLFVLTTATSIFNGMTASPSLVLTAAALIRIKSRRLDRRIVDQPGAIGKRGVELGVYSGSGIGAG
jgi:hypothetical protein